MGGANSKSQVEGEGYEVQRKLWVMKHILGSGYTSDVYLAEDTRNRGRLVALKKFKVVDDEGRSLEKHSTREISILERVGVAGLHKNIIQYFGTYMDGARTVLVLEYAAGGTLIDRLIGKGKFSEKHVSNIMLQVSSAVEFLHTIDPPVLLGDIKPSNIMLMSKDDFPGIIKLSDFGHSCELIPPNDKVRYNGATHGYQSPEQVSEKVSGLPSDIWCIGVSALYILTGELLFWKEESYDFDFDFRSNKAYKRISHHGRTFTEKLLQKRPEDRPNATEVCELAEEWHNHASHEETLDGTTLKRFKNRLKTLISRASRGRGLKRGQRNTLDASPGRPSKHNNH